jgi:hypothetical protein
MRKLMIVLLALPMTANAGLITYDIAWTGAAGSTMSGVFTFDEASAADGFVRDRTGDLLSLMLTTSDFGGLSWTWDGNSGDPFNFNFDALLELFPDSGAIGSTEAQSWNGLGGGLGLGVEATSGRSGLLIDGSFREGTASLTATKRAAIPEPGTLALFGLGLAAIGLVRRRKTTWDSAGE